MSPLVVAHDGQCDTLHHVCDYSVGTVRKAVPDVTSLDHERKPACSSYPVIFTLVL